MCKKQSCEHQYRAIWGRGSQGAGEETVQKQMEEVIVRWWISIGKAKQ